MSADDVELDRLRKIEHRASLRLDRLRTGSGLLSDPTVISFAEDLWREAKAAVEGHLANHPEKP